MRKLGRYWQCLVRGKTTDGRPFLRSGLHMVLAITCWLGLGLVTVAIVVAVSPHRAQQATLPGAQVLR